MTPQEQQLVTDLFDRLASLEDQRRDPDAERLIREGLGRAPNSVYALVQSVLVQDEALKRANSRIEELERAAAGNPGTQPQQGGFLDSMRNMLGRGSVPSVRPPPQGGGTSGVWGTGPRPEAAPQAYPQQGYPQGYQPAYAPGGMMGGGLGGGSFLGTAAAAAAGVIGGGLLLDGIRSTMGGHHGFGDYAPMGPSHVASPWGGGDGVDHGPGANAGGSGDLARDAGIDDIGRDHAAAAQDDSGHDPGRASFFGGSGDDGDDGSDNQQADDYDDGGGDGGGDFGGDLGGDDSA
jgi:uncharacterized protein